MACLIFGAQHHCFAAALVWCHFCDLSIYCNIPFGALLHWCYVFVPLVCYSLASLVCLIVGALQLWWIIFWLQYFFGVMYLRCMCMYVRWIASLVNYILVAIFLWFNVSSLHCIFGVMYMHFWYAMHRQLCWCLVGVITIVQCIFGALFLGFGCCVFGAMHCQLYRAGLLPQWRIYFIFKYLIILNELVYYKL